MNKLFWEYWIVDSAISRQDPVQRFIYSLYRGLWIPFVLLGILCFYMQINYFLMCAFLFKMIFNYWIYPLFEIIIHPHIIGDALWHALCPST